MPIAENGSVKTHYQWSGSNNDQVLVLLNSIGSSLRMWDKVLAVLENHFRILRYDMRGHGSSSVPPAPYSIEDLGQDLAFLMDHLGIDRAHLCGLSLGGEVALWMGVHESQRVDRMVLANTASRIGTMHGWDERIANVRSQGIPRLAAATLSRWFTPTYRAEHGSEMETILQMICTTSTEGYIGCCAALRDADVSRGVPAIVAPCLVIAGRHDPATPPAQGRRLHSALRQSKYIELNASHLSAWEKADEFAGAVLPFLQEEVVANG